MQWEPTPYRKDKSDEYLDVEGYGRFRVKRSELGHGYRVLQNGEPIGSIHLTPKAAKEAAEGICTAFQ